MRDTEAVWGIIDIDDNEWLSDNLNGTTEPAMYIFYKHGLYGDVLVSDVPADVQAKMFLREIERKEVAPLTILEHEEESAPKSALPIWIAIFIIIITAPVITVRCLRKQHIAKKMIKK